MVRTITRRCFLTSFAAIWLVSVSVLAHGQSPTGHPAVELTAPTDGQSERAGRDKNASSTLAAKESSVAPAGDVTNSANLEAFFDGSVRVQMDTRHIAGAVVAGGKVVFMKG